MVKQLEVNLSQGFNKPQVYACLYAELAQNFNIFVILYITFLNIKVFSFEIFFSINFPYSSYNKIRFCSFFYIGVNFLYFETCHQKNFKYLLILGRINFFFFWFKAQVPKV